MTPHKSYISRERLEELRAEIRTMCECYHPLRLHSDAVDENFVCCFQGCRCSGYFPGDRRALKATLKRRTEALARIEYAVRTHLDGGVDSTDDIIAAIERAGRILGGEDVA